MSVALRRWWRNTGPGWLVTAAFVGPGTVTTATVAGARFGTLLLWALLFSTVATIVLQEMSARLGLVTGAGLGEAIRRRYAGAARMAAIALVIGAIAIGNAAYETGNLLGAALGLEELGPGPLRAWALGTAAAAGALLWTGSYRVVERTMIALVVVMGIAFVATAIAVLPETDGLARGLFVPTLPSGSALTVIALVGTTVVPYNLFLHAATVREKWAGVLDLPAARRDLTLSIAFGGALSMAIVVTAAATLRDADGVASAADMARQLEPSLGRWATALFAIGLAAAGVTSAITAPLAAAYATAGALGWPRDLRAPRVRAVWALVLLAGAVFAVIGVRPVPAILFAQAANGVLLPAVAIFLLVVVNDRSMGSHANGWVANLLGVAVVAVTLLLGARAVLGVFGIL
ncbi:MAG: Nramp family divalent metal transporter [Gemmatimonadota bacterium]